METEALTVVYLYLGIGATLLIVVLVVTIFRKVGRVVDKMDIFAQLMIGLYEQEKEKNEKTDEGGFGSGEFQLPRRE